jgi:hypothetical protein
VDQEEGADWEGVDIDFRTLGALLAWDEAREEIVSL